MIATRPGSSASRSPRGSCSSLKPTPQRFFEIMSVSAPTAKTAVMR
jgi:hypothetical protein